MMIHDYLWQFMTVHDTFYGSWWFMIIPNVTIHDNSWKFITTHANSLQLMRVHDSFWRFIWWMLVHDESLCFMTFYDASWKFMTIDDNPWRLMKVHDMTIHGILRKFMLIHANSCRFMTVQGGSYISYGSWWFIVLHDMSWRCMTISDN